jgi:Zn-dependent M28 family amino/carboxypeptidase
MPESNGALQDALAKHIEKLCVEIGPRSASEPDKLAQAARYIRDIFEDAGLVVTEQTYPYRGRPVTNLIAAPPSADRAGAYYLVGAHYDTVPGTPGADDNASGVAVVLELARRLGRRPPPVPVRLAAFTLEEPPNFMTRSQGSRVYLREVARRDERILGAIVLEMVGFTSPEQSYPLVLRWAGYPRQGNFIGIVGNLRSRRFARTVLTGFRRNAGLPAESLFVPFNGWILPATRLSDHASFWDRGWPAVMVTDTAFFRNPNYHTSRDRPETLDRAFMAELVTSLEHALDALAG